MIPQIPRHTKYADNACVIPLVYPHVDAFFSDQSPSQMMPSVSQADNSEDFEFLENLTISAGKDSETDKPEDTIFTCATEESLHGPPIQPSSPTARGRRTWVVFNGRKVGIYQTW
jgi:hypothetical protein